jgi:hypothetical protein
VVLDATPHYTNTTIPKLDRLEGICSMTLALLSRRIMKNTPNLSHRKYIGVEEKNGELDVIFICYPQVLWRNKGKKKYILGQIVSGSAAIFV